jgi:RNA polymerase sigma-70 factor, ECF subfamily
MIAASIADGETVEDAALLLPDRDARAGERDEELALAARSDVAAFGILYARHRLSVFRYLRARTPTDDDAAELTAVAFERALAAISSYRPIGGGVLAWLLRIARNAAIDAGRRRSVAPLAFDIPDDRRAVRPEEIVLASEARTTLIAAFSALPEIQRDAIVLRYAARLTAREIGDVLGKSEAASQKLLSRALARIRESYRVDV